MADDNNVFDMQEHQTSWTKWIKTAVIIVVLLAVLVIGLMNVFIVQQGEYKVVTQFGEVVRIENEPGLSIKVPFIQQVQSLPKYQMNYDITSAEINTLDKKRVLVDNYAVWRVESPQAMIANARTIENAESIMANFINSVMRSELGQLEFDQIINEEDSARGDVNEMVSSRVNELLADGNYGIVVTDVRMKRTDLPEDNEKAVYRRMISERESTAQEYLSEGDAEANRIRANTDKEVTEMLSEAEADAEEIIGEGEAQAAEIYNSAFSRDPEFYELYKTLETYETTIDDETVIVLPSDSPYARILMGYVD
ncbi:membrane protease subunit HflC [Alteribacillus persepolensis]|uniref:Protein HflC n=1 Tax=Alteribacillus persepolensis TaxID=568899 RepID=A0A1G8BJE2_9BACI|nr:protease modulator HflC [Alteribacillus persepolensis]SDH33342.1 membrane protease subunit HflC [Alteribacillus persepolensis]